MTAVEWLLENLISEPYSEEDFKYNEECWNRAKEIDKEQKIEFAKNCLQENDCFFDIEQYYNKTFKSE